MLPTLLPILMLAEFPHHLSLRLCSALATLLTILTLLECTSNTAHHPYPCGVPSQHAPDPTYPNACRVHSRHAPDAAAHPYACGVPSPHAPDTTYCYACVVPSRYASQNCLPFLCSGSALPPCSQHHLSLCFRTTSIVYSGLLAYTMNAIAQIC
ncbi:hypothetical protein O181_114045 [Austropuccinia psidii MF-1]|uniref:Uncharacterized protein n=1 Tax=Austropuccinia psidii MF-1 TaxID=1389203 RepID=A0A9Q3K7N5_9BASI|nr:hypothetical protein [Austropuccinia psidii MF-1]